ncbi:ABC transporter permease [Nitratireductor indicus]|uniref:Binding-protein dependent transport system inner membrane protein n=1 Tax=Nitratireductor indicus C115 TaxID=1231190 RepID=K2NQK6_9HYPH|nr:ABC transporter permease [Nitratireductor indicus]EKF41640.1 binding-protein dependent transport system inner membrane protein [Nitratireductor indicus C115]MDS1136168.1 ABC transporter permease [Nitratireductor indicus]SFQ70731.1 NitT/TauT family transport system permease protein [Nitratireductor indicus]
MERLTEFGWRLLPFVVVIALWYGVRWSGLVDQGLLPPPHLVFADIWQRSVEGTFLIDIWMSVRRVLLGLLFGMLLAVPVGFLIGWDKRIRRFVDPLINFFRALPPIALIPLAIVYLGIGEVAKVAILFYAAFFSGVIVMYEGMSQTNPLFIRVSRTLGATDWEVFSKIIVPLTLPHVLTATRVALGVAWATLVASELVAAQNGIGAVIQNASAFFNLTTIYAGIITIGFFALMMDTILRWASRQFLDWQEREAQ